SGRGEVYASLQLEPRGIDETAFIMYSSGSTASPKGALTSFGNMHHQFEMIALSLDAREQPVNCWWAPHFHDFGLLSGFLNTLHQGGHCVVTSPMYFIQRPAIWLDMLHKYSATHTFGPDFGYQLLVKRTTAEERASGKWDLRSLRVAMSAAEKVRDSTLNQFHAAFADCGFRPETFCPAYGLAEHTVGVTINGVGCPVEVIEFLRDPLEEEGRAVRASEGEGRQERTMRLVGCGTPWNDIDLRIVGLDDEGHPQGELGPDQVGEVWVASGSKTLGYYNLPELSKEVFEATLPGDASGSANYYLRTGDYGFVEQVTGELFICGRKKDMVIIAGKNHYSEDLELTASTLASDHIRPGRIAAFSTEEDDSGSEVLILVGEVRSAEQVNRRDAFRALNDCIAAEHKVAVDKIVLIDPGTIPKTTSGKLRRFLIREQLLDGALSVIAGGTWIRPQSSEDSQQEAEGARPELENSQQEAIAVVGNCLGSLTAAWKLAQSGRRVTLYHEFNQVQSDGSAFWTLSKDLSPNLAELVKTAGIKLTRSSDGGASGLG
ncbi:MAG: AMP-binding protein, partial [Myxococcota bacterium]|nr:AMP-binding protein [Myxococcota bacterium]